MLLLYEGVRIMGLIKNEIYNLEITGMTAEGNGVGRIDGIAVFVPNSAIGDKLEIKIVKIQKNFAFGKIEKIISPSSDRQKIDCDKFIQCGGCSYRHITYQAELKIKQQRVQDAITRIGNLDIQVSSIVSSPNEYFYRNKAQLPVGITKDGRIYTGFFAQRSHRIVECTNCKLQNKSFNKAEKIFCEWANKYKISVYDEKNHKGLVRHLYLRYAEKTSELMVCIVINGDNLPNCQSLIDMLQSELPSMKSFIININKNKTNVILGDKCKVVWGKDYIEDILCELKFQISPLSFYQVNRSQAENLYTFAKKYADLSGNETLIDLYCGTGTIGLSMADKVKHLIGVEIIPQAIENAKKNAINNNIENTEFICGDATICGERLQSENIKPDIIVIDPPRKGCDKDLLKSVADMNPNKIIYISCDPATLARDLKILDKLEYKTLKVTPFDMFPRTNHVEVISSLSKLKK